MRRYLINLLKALRGIDPFQHEFDRMKEDYNRVAEQVAQLEIVFDSVKKMTDKSIKDVESYQRLVENLRKRLSEKEELIESMKQDYQQRANAYKTEIALLKADGNR